MAVGSSVDVEAPRGEWRVLLAPRRSDIPRRGVVGIGSRVATGSLDR